MRVLIGCERSGIVRDAFRRLGHEAWSCDLEGVDPGGEWPQYHLFGDVRLYLDRDWDIGIFFPDCTYLTSSAEWALKDADFDRYPGVGYHQRIQPGTLVGAERRAARLAAVKFVFGCRDAPIRKKAIENPRGHLSRAWRRPDQIIHPNRFGSDASKATCLWLENLRKLRNTKWIEPRSGGMPLFGGDGGPMRWANQTDGGQNRLSPGADRAMDRAETYPGIANAMALQWGGKAA